MDGTMCHGTGCPMKDDCYRHTAEANPYRQSYFAEIPLQQNCAIGGPIEYDCDYFSPNKNEPK